MQAFADKMRQLVSGDQGSKWVIHSWQVQVVAMDFGNNKNTLLPTAPGNSDLGDDEVVSFPPAWTEIVNCLCEQMRVFDIVFDMAQLQISSCQDSEMGNGTTHVVFPIIKMCTMCPKLNSLRIRALFYF